MERFLYFHLYIRKMNLLKESSLTLIRRSPTIYFFYLNLYYSPNKKLKYLVTYVLEKIIITSLNL